MDVKITRKKSSGNSFLMEFDEEFMDVLSEEAQKTSTAMVKILKQRLLPIKRVKKVEGFKPMGHDFARKWVRFPQVIRRNLVMTAHNLGRPISVAYLASIVTGDYRRNKLDWNENLEAYGELPPRSPYSYFSDIIGLMVDMLISYGAAIGDRGKFMFESEQRLDEFIDNDMNFGEWQDDVYGLRTEPVVLKQEEAHVEYEEEDTFD